MAAGDLANGTIPDADAIMTLINNLSIGTFYQASTATPTDPNIILWRKTDEPASMQWNLKCDDGWHTIIIGGKIA